MGKENLKNRQPREARKLEPTERAHIAQGLLNRGMAELNTAPDIANTLCSTYFGSNTDARKNLGEGIIDFRRGLDIWKVKYKPTDTQTELSLVLSPGNGYLFVPGTLWKPEEVNSALEVQMRVVVNYDKSGRADNGDVSFSQIYVDERDDIIPEPNTDLAAEKANRLLDLFESSSDYYNYPRIRI